MTENETGAIEPLIAAPEAMLRISDKDLLDRVVALGRDAQNLDLVEVSLAESRDGLPQTITATLTRGANPRLDGVGYLFEPYRFAPERREGTANVLTLQSFIELVNRHKDEHSVIFGDTRLPKPKLTAVIDYHEKDGSARFSKHKIEYEFPLSEEYKAWAAGDGKKFDQAEFAAFLEDRIAELASPLDAEKSEYEEKFKVKIGLPNEILALSRGLKVYVNSEFKTAITLQSGEAELRFSEEHRGANGEKLIVPGLFMIQVPAFDDGEPLRIPARLRYRPAGGSVTWCYQLYRPDFWLRQQIKNDMLSASQATSLPAFEGAPEA